MRIAEVDLNTISDRMSIRESIQSGKVDEAMQMAINIDSKVIVHLFSTYLKVLQNNPTVLFHLQQQKLIELIRGGNIMDALAFAQKELAPKGEANV